MKKSILSLSSLFKQVLNESDSLNDYPFLNQLINNYQNFKMHGEVKVIIKPEDIEAFRFQNTATREVLGFLSRGQYELDYENKTPVGRVYNFMKGLYKQKNQKPDYKKAFEQLSDLIFNITSTSYDQVSNKRKKPVDNPTQQEVVPMDDSHMIHSTTYLKDNNTVLINKKRYKITDEMLTYFLSKEYANVPSNIKYKSAMLRNNLTLPSDSKSAAGLIYSLLKSLTNNCTNLMRSYSEIERGLGIREQKTPKIKSFQDVKFIKFENLHDGSSQIKLTYKLFRKDGTPYSERNYFTTIFDFYKRAHNFMLVNTSNRNINIKFKEGTVPKGFDNNTKYNIKYTFSNFSELDLILHVIDIEVAGLDPKSNFSTIPQCGAMDELIDFLDLGDN